MTRREAALRFFLWWAVLGSASWIGGTLFTMLVVTPLWSASPPETVRAIFGGTEINRTTVNFFGPAWMIARSLPLPAALALAWPFRRQRLPLLVTCACVTFAVIFTLAYIYPIDSVLMLQMGGPNSPETIRTMARHWIAADRIRFAVMCFGFIALLKAFATPMLQPR